jgi:hypothetical protein
MPLRPNLARRCLTPPPPPPRTKWTRHVPHPVLIGHAACLVFGSRDHDYCRGNGRVGAQGRRGADLGAWNRSMPPRATRARGGAARSPASSSASAIASSVSAPTCAHSTGAAASPAAPHRPVRPRVDQEIDQGTTMQDGTVSCPALHRDICRARHQSGARRAGLPARRPAGRRRPRAARGDGCGAPAHRRVQLVRGEGRGVST